MKKLLFLIPFSCFAMENMCYLALIPTDIKNKIAEYLPFADRESHEEANNRSEASQLTNNQVSNELWKKYQTHKLQYRLGSAYSPFEKFIIHNQNKSLLISFDLGLFHYDYEIGDPAQFAIYETKNNKEIHYGCFWYKNPVGHAALSNDGNCAALITIESGISHDVVIDAYYTLIVRNFKTFDERAYKLSSLTSCPFYFSVNSIHFNKQSTKIIIKGEGFDPQSEKCDVTPIKSPITSIIPITSEAEHKEKSKKTLELYLYRKAVCKHLQNNVKIVST